MIAVVTQFLLYNLLPAFAAGLIAWLLIYAGVQLFRIRHGKLRLCLLVAPLVKSTLVMLGLSMAFPWPRELFGGWLNQALPTRVLLPVFIVVAGVAVIGRGSLVARSRRTALAHAVPARAGEARVGEALDRVMAAFRRREPAYAQFNCEPEPARPDLKVTDAPLHSPLIVTEGRPTIVFPAALIPRLDDHELDGALAHEVAHLRVRNTLPCLASEVCRGLVAVNPMAALMASQLHREEEKACDDLAVGATGDPDVYAGMLLKSYRFASERSWPLVAKLQYVPQLLGMKPMLSERVERLVEGPSPQASMGWQYLWFSLLWIVVVQLFFVSGDEVFF